MRSLERVLDMAADRAIRLIPTLFPVRLLSVVSVPEWTLELQGEPGQRVLIGHSFSRRPIRNPFRDERVREAQLRQVAEVVGAFADHPAVLEWLLGDQMTAACQPASASAFEEWLGVLTEVARGAGARQPLRHGVSAADVVRSAQIDLSAMRRLGVGVQVADDWQAPWARGAGSWWPAFLAGYATRLSGAPAIVSNLNPSRDGSRSGDPAGAEQVAQAASLIREVGGGGCVAPFLFDFHDTLRSSPLFAAEPWALHAGLFRADGTPRESAQAWSDLAQRQDPVLPVPDTFPAPDPELRARDPETIARECFETFTQ
jgi:hypothetical protein